MVPGRIPLSGVEEYDIEVCGCGSDRETGLKAKYDLLTGLKGRLSPSGGVCQGHLPDTAISIIHSFQSLQITHAWALWEIKVFGSINQ